MPGTPHTDDCLCDNCYRHVDWDMGPPSEPPDLREKIAPLPSS